MKELVDKASSETITIDEEIELLEELNRGVEQLRELISKLPDAPEREQAAA